MSRITPGSEHDDRPNNISISRQAAEVYKITQRHGGERGSGQRERESSAESMPSRGSRMAADATNPTKKRGRCQAEDDDDEYSPESEENVASGTRSDSDDDTCQPPPRKSKRLASPTKSKRRVDTGTSEVALCGCAQLRTLQRNANASPAERRMLRGPTTCAIFIRP